MGMNDITEFANDQLPGLVGITWGGKATTLFATREAAEKVAAGEDYAKIVTNSNGQFLVAIIDEEEGDFIYA